MGTLRWLLKISERLTNILGDILYFVDSNLANEQLGKKYR